MPLLLRAPAFPAISVLFLSAILRLTSMSVAVLAFQVFSLSTHGCIIFVRACVMTRHVVRENSQRRQIWVRHHARRHVDNRPLVKVYLRLLGYILKILAKSLM